MHSATIGCFKMEQGNYENKLFFFNRVKGVSKKLFTPMSNILCSKYLKNKINNVHEKVVF